MKRSEINKALKEMEAMIREYRIALPPFCNLTPEEWRGMNHEYDEIRDNMLGWDITDYGLGRFDEVGFSLITLRNGNPKKKSSIRSLMRRSFCISKKARWLLCIFIGIRWKISSTGAVEMC